jgi:tetratricopeptide (TPR) repeat protein
VLLVGPRGIGKTHILALIARYVTGRLPPRQEWSARSKNWQCALFTEEEYAGQNSLPNFLLALFGKLREALPAEPSWLLPPNLAHGPDQSVIDCCFERLQAFHRDGDRYVLVLIDNLQKVLEQWPQAEHLKLRSFVSHNRLLVILGSAPSVFQEIQGQNAAFHDFFEIRILPELTNEQMLELVGRYFEEDGRRVEFESRRKELSRKLPAIELLTGGNPRLVLFLYEIAARSAFLDIETALRNLLEELREYFVRRFDELPSQARKVLDTIAQMDGPATPTEIAQAARLDAALVNAQLKRLKSGQYVRPIKLKRQKATRYDISERLFRIWRQTATVAGRQRFRFLADFLKLYFTPQEIRSLYESHEKCLLGIAGLPREEVVKHVEELFYFQAAGGDDIRYAAFSKRMEGLLKIGEVRWAEEEAQYLAAESTREGDELGTAAAYKVQATIHIKSGRYDSALDDVRTLINVGAERDALVAAQELLRRDPTLAEGWLAVGMAAGNLGDNQRALEAFSEVAKIGGTTSGLLIAKSLVLIRLNRTDEALKCAEDAVAVDATDASAWKWLGRLAARVGNMERALEALRKAVEVGMPTADLLAGQSMALRDLGRGEQALKCAERAVALDIQSARAWEALGVTSGTLGDHTQALTAFRKAVELSEPSADLLASQSVALRALGRKDEALKCAEQAVTLDARSASAWKAVAGATNDLGQHERALAALCNAAELGEPTADLWTAQVIVLVNLGRAQEARLCADRATQLNPTSPIPWAELGIALHRAGDRANALEAFRKAAETTGPTADLWRCQSIEFRNLGRMKEALACAESGVAMDPSSASAWQELGVVSGSLGDNAKALDAFRKAIEIGGPTADLLTNRSVALRALGQTAEALVCAEQATRLEANSASAWEAVGIAANDLGQHERALTALCKAAELGKPAADLWASQAIVLLNLGRAEEALKSAHEAFALSPASPVPWEGLGIALGRAGKDEDALEAFKNAVRTAGPSGNLWRYQSVALQRLGRAGEALECAERAVAADPKSPLAWERLGMAAGACRNPQRALEALGRAAELGGPTAELYVGQAVALGELGREKEALKLTEQAALLDPNSASAWKWVGIAAGNLGDYSRALDAFRKAREVGEPTVELLVRQSAACDALGRGEEALECAERAVALDARESSAWQQLGVARFALGQHERGLEAFRRATDAAGPTADLLAAQSSCLVLLGRTEESIKLAEQALELDANDAVAWLNLGIAAESLGRFDTALNGYRRAQRAGKEGPELFGLEAGVLERLGRHEESLSVLDKALVAEPGNQVFWFAKAWTLAALGRSDEALGCVESARQKGAAPVSYHQNHGGLLLLVGRYTEALADFDAGLKIEPGDWSLETKRQIALGCLRRLGPLLEALPSALAEIQIPVESTSLTCDFVHSIALTCLHRGESQVCEGLFDCTLAMESWGDYGWFGKKAGNFLRQVLDINPQAFRTLAGSVARRVRTEAVLKLLEPFLRAKELLETRDVGILERLFPEVREVVLDILRRVEPGLHERFQTKGRFAGASDPAAHQ